MPYLIDGHNLIGAFPGLSLSDPDDEKQLVERLERFARYSRHKVIVFFDCGRPDAGPATISSRMVQAHFVPPPRKADDAILDFLRGRKDGRHFTVVSSDSEICAHARRAGAKVIPAKRFVIAMRDLLDHAPKEKPTENPDEVEGWLKAFERK